jgi:hypothetical protein
MKHALPNFHIQLFVAISLATIRLTVLQAEPHCPGSIASVTPRVVQHALIVIPVRINHAGPFDFIVDTAARSRLSNHRWPRNSASSPRIRGFTESAR